MTFKLHPVVYLFDPLPAARREKLNESIRHHGCPPVTLWRDEDGAEYLIDGQLQAEICEELGLELPTTVFPGTEEEAILHAWSLNKDRRQLKGNQGAMVGARLAKVLSEAAAKRQKAGKVADKSAKGKAAERAAKMVGLSTRTVEMAKTALDNGVPDLLRAVQQDLISISDAAKVAKGLPEGQRRAVKAVETGDARTAVEAAKPFLVDKQNGRAAVAQQPVQPQKPSMAALLSTRYEELFQLLQECLSVYHSHPAFTAASEHLVTSRQAIDLWKRFPDADDWRRHR